MLEVRCPLIQYSHQSREEGDMPADVLQGLGQDGRGFLPDLLLPCTDCGGMGRLSHAVEGTHLA